MSDMTLLELLKYRATTLRKKNKVVTPESLMGSMSASRFTRDQWPPGVSGVLAMVMKFRSRNLSARVAMCERALKELSVEGRAKTQVVDTCEAEPIEVNGMVLDLAAYKREAKLIVAELKAWVRRDLDGWGVANHGNRKRTTYGIRKKPNTPIAHPAPGLL